MDIKKLLGIKSEPKVETTQQTDEDIIKPNTIDIEYKKTGTYKRIIELLPEEALSSLPNIVFKYLGYNFIASFKEALIKMRKTGLAHLVYAKVHGKEGLFLPESVDNFRYEQDQNTKIFRYFLKNEEIDPNTVLVFGNQSRPNECKLHININQQQTILHYEQALSIFYNKLNNSYAWIFKLAGFNDKFSFINNQEIESKIKDIKNRAADAVVYVDKEDDFTVAQMNLSWFESFIKEYKTKICVDFNIPFTKFFGEAATGFNATGEGDRRSWYDTVKSFQALYIFNNLKQYASLINQQEALNSIDLENIETEDKELEANIQNVELNNIILAHNNGLIDDDVAKDIVMQTLNLTIKEK